MSLGNVPSRYDVALRTTKLDRVIEYEPADLTVTVEAGIIFGRLQALLAERRQFLPIDAPPDATVGGVLAAGASGASRHAYGLPRDWLIGCRLALADGTLIKCGGRVVKNVAGYDMQKLAVGSLGTLGVIVEVTFKVAPLPPAQETLLAAFSTVQEAAAAIRAADERSLALRGIALRLSKDTVTAAFWLSGPVAAVQRTRRELEEICQGAKAERLQDEASDRWWANVGAGLDPPSLPVTSTAILRVSLLPSQIPAFIELLPAASEGLAYLTTGRVLVRLDASQVDGGVTFVQDIRRWAADSGGSVVVTAAPIMVKERLDVWDDAGSALPLMRRLKEQFDPRGTLNPGRSARLM